MCAILGSWLYLEGNYYFSTSRQSRKSNALDISGECFLFQTHTLFRVSSRFSTRRERELDDTWEFDVNSSTWTIVSSAESPSGRAGLALASAENGLVYLFGGGSFDWELITSLEESLLYNTIIPSDDSSWVLDLSTGIWRRHLVPGDIPPPRAFAGFSSRGLSLYLFGGLGKKKKKLNDLWEFDIQNSKWTLLQVENIPSARFGMTLIARQDSLFIVGGKTWWS